MSNTELESLLGNGSNSAQDTPDIRCHDQRVQCSLMSHVMLTHDDKTPPELSAIRSWVLLTYCGDSPVGVPGPQHPAL